MATFEPGRVRGGVIESWPGRMFIDRNLRLVAGTRFAVKRSRPHHSRTVPSFVSAGRPIHPRGYFPRIAPPCLFAGIDEAVFEFTLLDGPEPRSLRGD